MYRPNAETTLDLEANEVKVKVLTSLAPVTGSTASQNLSILGRTDCLSVQPPSLSLSVSPHLYAQFTRFSSQKQVSSIPSWGICLYSRPYKPYNPLDHPCRSVSHRNAVATATGSAASANNR